MYCGIVFEVVCGNIWVVCGMSIDRTETAVLEMAGLQVAKCDQKSFWATSFGQKYVYLCVYLYSKQGIR